MPFDFGTLRLKPWRRAGAVLALTALTLSACGKGKAGDGAIEARPAAESRPNILVIEVDHLTTTLGAYGDKAAQTPNIDRLAREGVTFTDAYAASGGEDAETVALLTGMHPSTIGMVQEWTGEPQWTVVPPPEVRAYPELLRAAGYHSFHMGARVDPFGSPDSLWTQNMRSGGWPTVNIRQPFVGVIDLSTLPDAAGDPKPRSFWDKLQFWRQDPDAERRIKPVTDARKIAVPANLPDTPEVRAALKNEYDRIHHVDDEVGHVLARLDKAGVLKNTVVIFTAKTGPARPGAERTVYDGGVHVPLIVRFPDGKAKGTVRRDLVSGVDLAPSVLKLAHLQPLAWMQGKDRLTTSADPAKFAFTVQNRVDGVYERVFAVRDGRWLYLMNLAPTTVQASLDRAGPMTAAFEAARKAGRLTAAQQRLYASERPEAELYDLKADPQAQHNLAEDAGHSGDVTRLSQVLNAFAASAPDTSTASTQDLKDSYKPGGQTPMAVQPTSLLQGGRLMLASMTPGATILWRPKDGEPWRIYTTPVVVGPAQSLQAKTVRYGFDESSVITIDLKR
ncbi:MAG: sulfatase-like hydrolase/transferase [Proteobacteria bacterium]|nr:sulfatase-like hydrolase/transferase [Pseudomonadota bacterium]